MALTFICRNHLKLCKKCLYSPINLVIMPSFTTCVGCDIQKRSKNEKFYNISDLSILNNLRRLNSRKRLSELNDIPVNNKICRNCFQLSKQDNILMQRPDDTSDLSFYRNGNNSHHQCTFGCKQNDKSTLTIRIPKKILQDLLMNYKFFVHEQSRMCIMNTLVYLITGLL